METRPGFSDTIIGIVLFEASTKLGGGHTRFVAVATHSRRHCNNSRTVSEGVVSVVLKTFPNHKKTTS